jgi:hypothetical protein
VTDGPDIYDEGVIGCFGSGGLFRIGPVIRKAANPQGFLHSFLNLLMREKAGEFEERIRLIRRNPK